MRIAIYGYGNLGRGVEAAAKQHTDARITAIFTRRDPSQIQTAGAPVYSSCDILEHSSEIDALIVCGGSATELPNMTPALAEHFNVVDSFDTHAAVQEHFERVDRAARSSGHIALISGGWDPGVFSLARLYASAFLPNGEEETFWGRGISQGHSDAIRRIRGVVDARQYTVPIPGVLEAFRSGELSELTAGRKHTRECYVVAEEGAELARIEAEIKSMPNYFADYETTVKFVSLDELREKHSRLSHGGAVIRRGRTGLYGEHAHTLELTLGLESNPEFTASVLLACAGAILRMHKRGELGCKTIFDIAPAELSPLSSQELRARML